MMKTIIAGTDFTASSLNACKYAALLAEKLNCKLTLFNLFEAPIIHTNVGLYGIAYSSVRQNSQRKMNKVAEELQELFPNLELKLFISNGAFKEELDSFIAAHRVAAAVMGLEAKNRISKFIYGSHGVNLVGKIEAPVFIIPQQYKKHKLENVLLAVDNTEKLHASSLKGFEKFVAQSGVHLKLLHVRTRQELIVPVMKPISLNGKMRPVELIDEVDIQDGIRKYCRLEAIDLVAMLSRKHSAFYNFFVESNTKKVAFATKIPVLSLHE